MIKKIQVYLIFLFVLSVQISLGQNEDQFSPHLPQVIPVSPEAASLGKFGDVPVNLSIGKLNYTIPLYTIKVGGFSYPIYLQYNSTGLKTEEDPALVGLGWTLSAEGMITRQLRGRNDESAAGWLTMGTQLLSHQTDRLWRHDFFTSALDGLYDAQPDKFSINAGNFGGSFVFNEVGEPLFYPYQNYKVVFGDDNHTNLEVSASLIHNITNFTVQDDAGIIYYFGAEELTELSDNPGMDHYNSSWKLEYISFLNNKHHIRYYYRQAPLDSLYVKTTYSEAKYPTGLPPQLSSMATRRETQSTVHQQLLDSIVFPNGKIEFITRTIPANSFAKNKYYLDKVIIYEGNPVDNTPNASYRILKTYKFIYNNLISNYRLLKEIQLFDANNTQQPFYRFSYYDEDEVPDDIYYANQDSWGYYNGKTNTDMFHGDRSVDLYSTRLGMLDTIFYPTGGYTQIEYELNKIKYLEPAFQYAGQCYSSPLSKHKTITASSHGGFGPPLIRDTITINCHQTIRVEFGAVAGGSGISGASAEMTANRFIDCNMLAGCSDGCSKSEEASQELGGGISIDDLMDGNIDLATFIAGCNGSPSIDEHRHTSYFDVPAGTQLFFEASAGGNGVAIANIDIDYTDECENIEVGGLRINKTTDYTQDHTIIHHYEYVDRFGYNSSGNLYFLPIFSEQILYDFPKPGGGRHQGFFYKIFTTSQVPMVSTQGNTVFYDRVVTYTNDLNLGKTVSYFDTTGLTNMVVYPSYPVDLFTIQNGELKKQEVFKKENQDFTIEKTNYSYYHLRDLDPVQGQYQGNSFIEGNLVEVTKYSDLGNNIAIMPYSYERKKLFLSSQREINHLANGNLETQTNYTYDLQRGYLKEQTTTGSDGKQTKITNYYPYEIHSYNSHILGILNQALSTDELGAYQDLTQKNIIASPIQVEKEVQRNNETYTQRLRTTYKQDLNTGYTLPDKVSVALLKTNGAVRTDFEPRIVYHQYDEYGNPVEVSKADGTHIYYVWGYQHTQPIAKIVNCTYAQAQSHQSEINAAIIASDNDVNAATEDDLRNNYLDAIRQAFPNAQVTTYTYDPLIGVTSITDPKGDTQYYEYDNLQRLKFIKDKDRHILKEYEYHYK